MSYASVKYCNSCGCKLWWNNGSDLCCDCKDDEVQALLLEGVKCHLDIFNIVFGEEK